MSTFFRVLSGIAAMLFIALTVLGSDAKTTGTMAIILSLWSIYWEIKEANDERKV
jgi:hypothetical protein